MHKNQLQSDNADKTRHADRLKNEKKVSEETTRRINNDNTGAKKAIESDKKVIQKLLEATDNANRYKDKHSEQNKIMENEADQRKRHVNVLEDQNQELCLELDQFLISDVEIRAKLKDRNRSPLRVEDLHLKN